jgi:hypothetical protein
MARRIGKMAGVLAVCATALAVLAAPAGAVGGFKQAKFRVELKGWQKTVQQHHHLAEDRCDVDNFTSGSELVNFRSIKPVVVTAMMGLGLKQPEFFAGRRLHVPSKATIKRSYTPRGGGSVPADCGGAGGCPDCPPPPPPDCGTKTVNPWGIRIEYADAARNTLWLEEDFAEEPFQACPSAGNQSFPTLLSGNTKGKVIGAHLTPRDLFNPAFKKWISIASGSYRYTATDYWAKTTIRWEVSFTRLGEKKGR